MRRFVAVVCALVMLTFLSASGLFAAENFPSQPSTTVAPTKPAPGPQQPRLFYGYVPPAPIRHVWPGGYKVMFNQLTNTFIEHLLGQY